MNLQLVRNAGANLLGAAIPAAVALATVPLVVRGLGDAGYGVYALITAIVGYFAIIDINVTAGSVQHIAAQWAHGEQQPGIAQTITFGLLVYAALGALGALALWGSAAWLVHQVFDVPPALRASATAALKLAAAGFLVGQLQSYLDSVPQALLRYDSSARLDVLFGSIVPIATVAVLMAGGGLVDVILLRVLASSAHCLLLWRTIRRLLPALRLRWPTPALRRSLLRFSAYACLNRFAAMSYAYADKLIIGALVGVAGLAVYAVASTLANRLLGLTGRLASVLFPATSALAARQEVARLVQIYLKASRYLTFINGAMLLLVALFAEPILRYWMSNAFAQRGATVLALIALAQCIDSLTALPSLVNDGMGQPAVTGGFALARALLGLLTVSIGVLGAGIDGAAWGHLAASTLMSALFLRYVHGRTVPVTLGAVARAAYLPCALGLLGIGLLAMLGQAAAAGHPAALLCTGVASGAALALYGVLVIAVPADRGRILALLLARSARGT